jgi:hypothetical protein
VKIRILTGFSGYAAGQVVEWGDGMSRIYIARGMAEEVKPEPVERATQPEPVERATLERPIKRRAGK